MSEHDEAKFEGELDGLLGRGRVEETDEGERVFVKCLDHVEIPDLEAFERHFESLARLDHPHLVRYLECRPDTDPVEVVQEYVDGTEFLTYLRQAPSVEEIRTLRRQLAEEGRSVSAEEQEDDEASDDEAPTAEAEPREAEASELDDTAEATNEQPEASSLDPGEGSRAGAAEPPREDENRRGAESDDSQELLDETPVPEPHRYSEGRLGEESSDVVLDPPESRETREIELIDVVFLRLERLMPQILGALEYLHRFRQPHGGLKPTNLLVDTGGRCKLADFGILTGVELLQEPSADADSDPADPENLEYARAYLAPEVRANFEPSPEADLYALGCILFEAITGCRPFPTGTPSDGPEAGEDQERNISEELDAVEADEEELDEESPSPATDGEPTPDPDRRFALRASAISELEPRCPAAWTDLILRLLDSDPSRRPDFDEIREVLATSRGRSVDVPPSFIPEQESFFGRDEIFERLVEHAQTCIGEDALRITVLSGAAGYGKTAMAQRLGQWAAQRGWVVLRGRCYDEQSVIYQGWNEIAEQLAEICHRAMGELDEQTERLRRRAARLFPSFHPDGPTDAPLDRLASIDGLRELLRIVAAERPVLLMIDDLNWASPDTTALLADLVGEPEGLQCMVVPTWRAAPAGEEPNALPAELTSAPVEIDRLELRGFRPGEAEAYVDTVADLEEEIRNRVLEIGGSNPLLLKELIYQLHLQRADETNDTDDTDGEAHLPGDVEDVLAAPDETPREKLIELIRPRLATLTRREMFVVQLLSIVSMPLPESIISFVVDREFHAGEGLGTSIRPLLDELRTKRLVHEVQTERWNHAFTLFHNLTRRLVLDAIPVQHYTHLCDHLADGLSRFWPEADELRFEYLLRADRTSEAFDSAVRTAQTAEDRYAYHRAAKLWRWLGEQQEETSRMTSVQPSEELARVEFLAGHFGEAADLYAGLSEKMPADVTRSQLRYRAFEARLASGQRARAIEALGAALEMFGDRYERSSLLQKFSEWKNRAVAATQRWSDDTDEVSHEPLGGREWLRLKLYRHVILKNDVLDSTRGERFRAKFSAIAEQSRDALLLGYDRLFLARDCHYYGVSRRPWRADEWYEETEKLFRAAEDAFGLAQMAVGRARLFRDQGEFDEADKWIDEAARRLDESEPVDERETHTLAYERALVHRERGELDRAAARAEKLRHFYRGNALAVFRANQVLLPVRLLRGQVARAEFLIEESREFLEEGPPCVATVWLARQRTRMNLAMGRPEVAQGLLNVLHDELRGTGLFDHPYVSLVFFMSRAQALIAALTRKDRIGEPRRGDVYDEIEEDVERIRSHSAALVPPLEAEVQRLSARFELLRNNTQLAFQHLEAATDRLARYPNPIARSMCAEAQGLALQQEDPEHGASLVEQSRIIYKHHGCHFPLVLEGWPVPERMSKMVPEGS